MGDSTDHSEAVRTAPSGDFAPVINNTSIGGLDINFAVEETWSWWHRKTVRVVRDGSDKSLSAHVFDTFNQ